MKYKNSMFDDQNIHARVPQGGVQKPTLGFNYTKNLLIDSNLAISRFGNDTVILITHSDSQDVYL